MQIEILKQLAKTFFDEGYFKGSNTRATLLYEHINNFLITKSSRLTKAAKAKQLQEKIGNALEHADIDKIHSVALDFFSDEQLVFIYYTSLSKAEKAFMELLIQQEKVSYQEAKQVFKKDILEVAVGKPSQRLRLKEGFQQWALTLFCLQRFSSETKLSIVLEEEKAHFRLPAFMRYAFTTFIYPNQTSEIKATALPPGWQVFKTEDRLLDDLSALLLLFEQAVLTQVYNNKVFNLGRFRNQTRQLPFKLFPNDPGYLKTIIQASFVSARQRAESELQLKTIEQCAKLIKNHVNTEVNNIINLQFILFPFKNIHRLDSYQVKQAAIATSFNLLKALPREGWVLYEELTRFAKASFIDSNPFDKFTLSELELPASALHADAFSAGSHFEKADILQDYTLRGVVLYAAALGIVELAYAPALLPQEGNFDNLAAKSACCFSACRLTGLGAYVFGLVEVYDPAADPNALQYILSEDSLTIQVKGNQPLGTSLLQQWVTSDSSGLWFNTAQVLGDCQHLGELTASLRLFQDTINQPLPAYWQAQFFDLVDKSYSLQTSQGYRIFQLDPKDKELQRLVVQDPVLRQLSIKAEHFIILVKESNWFRFHREIAKHGYTPWLRDPGLDPRSIDILECFDPVIKRPEIQHHSQALILERLPTMEKGA